MPLGAHMSIAGGIGNALMRGKDVGCECIQIFTKSSNQWKVRPLADDDITGFRENKKITGIWPVVAHNAYLINLASPSEDLHKKSLDAMLLEMERAETLDIPFIIMHPGA
ncbi:MAG: TIM barrel protein, partial [Deltaproteobacteria bacterium]